MNHPNPIAREQFLQNLARVLNTCIVGDSVEEMMGSEMNTLCTGDRGKLRAFLDGMAYQKQRIEGELSHEINNTHR